VGGIYGLPLVQAIGQQFPVYGVNAQLDLTSPGYYYSPDNYYVPNYAPTAPQYMAQYYVPPVDPAYVPPVVQTRVASGFAAGGANYALPQQTAPAIAAAPQVQRLLNAANGAAVVTNPAQARREIAHQARAARQVPIAAPAFAQSQAPQVMAQHGHAAFNRGHNIAARPPLPAQASPTAQMMRGVGHGRHVGTSGIAPSMAAPVVHGNGHGHGRAVAAAPQMIQHGNGNGHGRGHQQAAPVMAAPQPQVIQHGNGNGHGHGHGGSPMAVAPAPGPAPMVAAPQGGGGGHVPPGQEKKGKGH